MAKYDVTKLNVAIDKLLAVTENPGFFSRPIRATAIWRLRGATKRFLRRR
jgi:hypothetical protein